MEGAGGDRAPIIRRLMVIDFLPPGQFTSNYQDVIDFLTNYDGYSAIQIRNQFIDRYNSLVANYRRNRDNLLINRRNLVSQRVNTPDMGESVVDFAIEFETTDNLNYIESNLITELGNLMAEYRLVFNRGLPFDTPSEPPEPPPPPPTEPLPFESPETQESRLQQGGGAREMDNNDEPPEEL